MMVSAPKAKAQVLDSEGVSRAWRRIAHEIIERQRHLDNLVLIGIVTRGVPLAERLAASLQELEGVGVPVIALDVRAYRDDRPRSAGDTPSSTLPLRGRDILVKDRAVLLVDDVLFHGRTIRAAIDAVMASGRPASVQLAVLVDRGHRELPIRPDYVGKNVPTSAQEWVQVHVREVDGEDAVRILDRAGG